MSSKSWPSWATVIAAVIAACAAVWVGYLNRTPKSEQPPAPSRFSVVVHADNIDESPLPNADVDLGIPAIRPDKTDSRGQVFFEIPKELVNTDCRITVRKEGFETYIQQTTLTPSVMTYRVSLKILPPAQKQPLPPFSAPHPRLRAALGFIQLANIDIHLEASVIQVNSPLVFNINYLNKGAEPVNDVIGLMSVTLVASVPDASKTILKKFRNVIAPAIKDVETGRKKGSTAGVGLGIWGTRGTPPLTAEDVNDLLQGRKHIYILGWVHWVDLDNNSRSTEDCTWLQTPFGPKISPPMIWHTCTE